MSFSNPSERCFSDGYFTFLLTPCSCVLEDEEHQRLGFRSARIWFIGFAQAVVEQQ